jgi:sucrose phosphorylase
MIWCTRFQEFFTVFSTKTAISEAYLSLILRPRTSELLSAFSTLNGTRSVWTTFSRDQIDLNFKNPEVLLKMAQILLLYVRRGADLIRLDAITYLWQELGTTCAHLEETHTIIKLFRDILNAVAPRVALISETNVPHAENIEYFGDGYNEAQMVYNFALPPPGASYLSDRVIGSLNEMGHEPFPRKRLGHLFQYPGLP